MQLVAHGAQDVYLTGDPQITYFKVVYRRHTNFSMESIQQQFNTTPTPGQKTSCIVSRNGDLIGAMWLEFKLATGNNNNLGFASYINQVSIEIGGQKIDTHYGRWLDIWDDLTTDANKDEAMLTMLGNTSSQYTLKVGASQVQVPVNGTVDLTASSGVNDGNVIKITGTGTDLNVTVTSDYYNTDSIVTISPAIDENNSTITVTRTTSNSFTLSVDGGGTLKLESAVYTLTITDKIEIVNGTAPTTTTIPANMGDCFALLPLSFWFNRNVGLALPLIALQYHEIKLNIDFADTTVWTSTTGCRLWIDYIFLDSEERKRFAQMSHEYLIDQVQREQFDVGNDQTKRLDINFNHPVKELVWVAENTAGQRQVDITQVQLKLNGHDRFYPRCGEYFRLQQPYQFHSTVPPAEDIYVYSFALRPEEHQPSGTCNFSRIDSCQMTITRNGRTTQGTAPGSTPLSNKVYLYGINYNVLRVASGMAGLAYSN